MDKQRHGHLAAKVKTARQTLWHRPQTLQRSLVKLEAMAPLPTATFSTSPICSQSKQLTLLPGGCRSCAEGGKRQAAGGNSNTAHL